MRLSTEYRKLRTNIHGQILINLSVSLMALYITFLIGGFVTEVPALCGIVSALLQYFFLVFFAWTAVESIWLYLKLVAVLGSQSFASRYMLKAGLPAWCKFIMIIWYDKCRLLLHSFFIYTPSGPTSECIDKHSHWTSILHQSLLVGCNHTVKISELHLM